MRSVLLAAAATLAAVGAAQANPAGLTSSTVASVSGGCNGCGQHQDLTSLVGPLPSVLQDTNGFGSYSHAEVTTDYGVQHVYADAFQAPGDTGPDVQTRAWSEYDEHYAPGVLSGTYTMAFLVTGSMSVEPPFGPGADAYLNWDFCDITKGCASLTFGTWVVESGAPPPVVTFTVSPDDAYELDVRFVASAYSSQQLSNYPIFADYIHTVHTYIDPVNGGPDAIGQSGHDYATPSASGAPEPAAWALMLLGFATLGAAARRRRAATA